MRVTYAVLPGHLRTQTGGQSAGMAHGRARDGGLPQMYLEDLAGAEGLEPSTYGFGDRRSTS